jgi:hypothetical protein
MAKIKRNMIKCNICGDVIESTSVHNFVKCGCGACAVDGGHYCLRRLYSEEGCYTDLSEFEESEKDSADI